MPFERPTLETLFRRAVSDLETRLTGVVARLRKSFEYVVAKIVAGAAHGLHGHLRYVSKQAMPDTANETNIRRHGGIWGVPPTDPRYATGNVTATGLNTTPIPLGAVFVRPDGIRFESTSAVAISGSSVAVPLQCLTLGSDGNTEAGTILSLETPIDDIDSDATVDGSGITDGVDPETAPAQLIRILERVQTPPSGGGPGDYVRWAKEVSGVTRAWQYPLEQGNGTVVVRFVVDNELDIIPDGAKVAEVQAYIDSKAPVDANVFVVAPVAVPLDPDITLTPNTAAVQTAVTTELESMLIRDASPGATIRLSRINEAISLAEGETDHTLNTPAADKTHTTGQIAILGTPVWS